MKDIPFIFNHDSSGTHLIGRADESAELEANALSGRHTALVSCRGAGKTALLASLCADLASDEVKPVSIDMFMIRSVSEFCRRLAEAVLGNEAQEYLASAGESEAGFAASVLQLPELIAQGQGFRYVICLDEFQQISIFREGNALLKHMRRICGGQQSVTWIIAGDDTPFMRGLFRGRSAVFARLFSVLALPDIQASEWRDEIRRRYEASGKYVSSELAERIVEISGGNAAYVMRLAGLVWMRANVVVSEQDVDDAFLDLLCLEEPRFRRNVMNLTSYQMNFLRALCSGVHEGFTRRDVMARFGLSSSANVSIIVKALLKSGLIRTDGRRTLIADAVFERWLCAEFLRAGFGHQSSGAYGRTWTE